MENPLDDLKTSISDLVGVEPKSFGTDANASEGAAWLSFTKKAEADAEELLGPAIKKAFEAHKTLTGEKKSLLSKLFAAKDRVRVNLANWIAGGHQVQGCYIQRKWKVTVTDPLHVPAHFMVTLPDQAALEDWAKKTEGMPIAGCSIEQVNVLFFREAE